MKKYKHKCPNPDCDSNEPFWDESMDGYECFDCGEEEYVLVTDNDGEPISKYGCGHVVNIDWAECECGAELYTCQNGRDIYLYCENEDCARSTSIL